MLSINTINLIILLLIIIAIISTLSVPFGELTGPAIRHFSDFFSSMLLFFYISNLNFDNTDEKISFIQAVLFITLIMVSVQILISIFTYKFPSYTHFLKYFGPTKKDDIAFITGHIVRARSLIFTPESLGEFIALLSPILLYKFFYRNSFLYFLILILLAVGLVFSVTRSGILLFIFATMVFLIYNFKSYKLSSVALLTFGILLGSLLIIFFSPDIFAPVIDRFTQSHEMYQYTGKISMAINRERYWDNISFVFDNINFFGHGLLPPHNYPQILHHFHSLYLTILFQFGIVGSVVYFALFFLIVKRLLNAFLNSTSAPHKALIFAMILSVTVFLINEIKYEFNRHESYQQISWALFATYYLLTKNIMHNKES